MKNRVWKKAVVLALLSNSDILTERLVAGARDAGHQVEEISLKGKELKYCIGCLACQKTQRCVQKDDALWIADKMKDADTLVFSTPIYYYEMSGQMKTLLDRMNPLYSSDYRFRRVYMLSVAAEDETYTAEKAVSGLEGWVDCFEKASLKGIVTGGGIGGANAAPKHADVMRKAYELGNKL